jgi:hypothetical protein
MRPLQSSESDPMRSHTEDVFLSLGLVAGNTGEQAGALLSVIELLVHNRLISWIDAKRLVRLLSAGSPEARRRAIAQCVIQRKATPIRQSVSAIRRR